MHISPSNKRYIGITSKKPNKRWQNGKGYKRQDYFYRAIEKYGWDNFQHIIIARGLTEDEAKWLEVELIREWDTTNKDKGYNLTKGGDGCNGHKHSEETKRKMSKNHEGKHTGELNPMFGMKGELNPMFGKQHSEETKKKISEANSGENNPNIRKIILLNTKEIFPSITEGEKRYNIKGISNCCNGYQQSCGRLENGICLIWMFYDEYLQITEKEVQKKLKEIDNRIICITTNEIFLTIKEGAKKYNIKGISNISECCNGNLKSAGKLKDGTPLVWMFYNEYLNITKEEIQIKINDADMRVICITTNEIFLTATEGKKKYNAGHISECCNGKYKSSGVHPITGEKLIWMFYKDYIK